MTGLSPGTYNVTVTDDDGCVQTITITILAGGQASTVGIWHN